MRKSLFHAAAVALVISISSTAQAQSTDPSPYCDASFDDMGGFLVPDQIKSVSFGSLSNASNSQFAAPHYVLYNSLVTPLFTKGSTYTLNVKFDVHGGCGYGIWIDYNHNNAFEANEKIDGTTAGATMTIGNDIVITKSVTIPTTAMTGNTRMRVRIVEDDNFTMNSTDILPCNASTSPTDVMDWGETEDYTINIVGATGVNDIENSASVSIVPNPSMGNFSITAPFEINHVQIIDIKGCVVFNNIASPQKSIAIQQVLEPGMYFLKLQTAKGVLTKTLIIAK
jgi:hypothetical protein